MFFDFLDSVAFGIAFFVILLAGVALGRRIARNQIGRLRTPDQAADEEESWGARPVETAVLGLLALLLAFLFQFAGENYMECNKAIKRECDLIAGTYRYAKLLDEPEQTRLEKWCATYADHLTKPGWRTEVTDLTGDYVMGIYKSHDELWGILQDIGQREKPPILYENLVTHSEAMVESHYGTLYEIRTRLPWAMTLITILCAVLSSVLLGFTLASVGRTSWFDSLIFAMVISGTLFLINDLDAPWHGLIQADRENYDEIAFYVGARK